MLFLDGAYALHGSRAIFHRARRPTGDELSRLLDSLSCRIVRVLECRGLLTADPDHPCLDLVPDSSLDHLQAASVSYRIAIGPHTGRKALNLYSVPPLDEAPNHPLLARLTAHRVSCFQFTRLVRGFLAQYGLAILARISKQVPYSYYPRSAILVSVH